LGKDAPTFDTPGIPHGRIAASLDRKRLGGRHLGRRRELRAGFVLVANPQNDIYESLALAKYLRLVKSAGESGVTDEE